MLADADSGTSARSRLALAGRSARRTPLVRRRTAEVLRRLTDHGAYVQKALLALLLG